MKTQRRKGHSYERQVAGQYRAAGFPTVRTTRSAASADGYSQYRGDLVGLPWAVECKRRARYYSLRRVIELHTEGVPVVHVQFDGSPDRSPGVVVVAEWLWFSLLADHRKRG